MKMSLQTHYSGNITGQIPNQACNPLPGPPQQNGSALPSQSQNPSIPHTDNALSRNPDLVKARKYTQEKMLRHFPHPSRFHLSSIDPKCYDAEQKLEDKERHPVNHKDRHALHPLRKMLDIPEHASKCRSPNCEYPNCRGVKGLFLHARMYKKRAVGGCVPCRRMWRILRINSQACKESECQVPQCRDLREHMSRVRQQSESRRRAAVMEIMRQRAAEVACGS